MSVGLRRAGDGLGRVNQVLTRVSLGLALVSLAAMVVIVAMQIWFRYVLGTALSWPDEGARFMMLWMTGLAAPWGLRNHGFVAIDMIPSLLPGRAGDALRLVFLAIALSVFATCLGLGWDHVQSGWLFASSSLRLPLDLVGGASVRIKLAWMYMSLWVGMILMTAVTVEQILNRIADLTTASDRTDAAPSRKAE